MTNELYSLRRHSDTGLNLHGLCQVSYILLLKRFPRTKGGPSLESRLALSSLLYTVLKKTDLNLTVLRNAIYIVFELERITDLFVRGQIDA